MTDEHETSEVTEDVMEQAFFIEAPLDMPLIRMRCLEASVASFNGTFASPPPTTQDFVERAGDFETYVIGGDGE